MPFEPEKMRFDPEPDPEVDPDSGCRVERPERRLLLVICATLIISCVMVSLLFLCADGFRPGTGYGSAAPTHEKESGESADSGDTSSDSDTDEDTADVFVNYPFATVPGRDTYLPTGIFEASSVAGVVSQNYILVDAGDLHVAAAAHPDDRIDPASMTKIMTLIVLCDHITSLDEMITIPRSIVNDPLLSDNVQIIMDFIHDKNEEKKLPVGVLMNMIGIESAADAVLVMTRHVAGNDAVFVNWMNEKAAELGLTGTHFTNAIGLREADHYSTVADMASIMLYALENPLCREILGAASYHYHDEGAGMGEWLWSTLFVDRMEKKGISAKIPGGLTIRGGKTGSESYTDNRTKHVIYTLATYADDAAGHTYVAITFMDVVRDTVSEPAAQTVRDAITLYKTLVP